MFTIISLGNIDYSLVGLVLINVLLTSCYSFFTMSIVFLVGQAEINECYKDTNRIECSFMFLLFGIIYFYLHLFTVIISLPAFSSVSLNSIQLMIEWKWNERREKATAIHIHSVRSIIQSISPFHWRIEVELISVTPFTSASSCVTFRSISFRLFIADWNELKLIALISLRGAVLHWKWIHPSLPSLS